MSFTSWAVRRSFKKNDDKRDAGLKTPENVERFDDLSYGRYGKWNKLDVYRPKGGTGKLPVIVSVHGGGWVYGDKERYQYYCMSLVEHGFAVVNFTYRLAPEFKYPAPVEDTVNVFKWILNRENAEKYGFDVNHIFAVGDSAGGHLLGLYCCLCTDEGYGKTLDFKAPFGGCPKAVGLNCGVYRIELKNGRDKLMADFLPKKVTAEECRLISVTEHVNKDFPPAFVMTAEGDFLAEQAKEFVKLLQDKNVKVEYHYYGDKDHVLGHVFHCNMRLTEAKICNKDECDFFKGFLR